MKIIDVDEVGILLDKAVAKKGEDYIYQLDLNRFCAYYHGEEPGCIVGHVLADLGVDASMVRGADVNVGVGISGASMAAALTSWGIEFTEQAMDVLYKAQCMQDVGSAWGAAVKNAKEGRVAYS